MIPCLDFAFAGKGANDYFKQFFHGMLSRGIYLPPSTYESRFLSNALNEKDIEKTLKAAKETFAEIEIGPIDKN